MAKHEKHGETPALSAVEQLKAQQEALAVAEAEQQRAEAAFDEQEAVQAGQRVEVLRRFVASLTALAAAEVQADTNAAAKRLYKERCARYGEKCAALAPAIQRAREAITAAAPALDEAFAVFGQALIARHEAELLRQTAPDLVAVTLAPVPEPPDMVGVIVALERVAIPRPPRLTIPRGASDTPAQVRRSIERALRAWLPKHGHRVDAELRAVLTALASEEPAEERAKRETLARAEEETTRVMLAGLAGEAARVQTRRGM